MWKLLTPPLSVEYALFAGLYRPKVGNGKMPTRGRVLLCRTKPTPREPTDTQQTQQTKTHGPITPGPFSKGSSRQEAALLDIISEHDSSQSSADAAAAFTIAVIPVLTASGSLFQDSTTTARSGIFEVRNAKHSGKTFSGLSEVLWSQDDLVG